MSQSERIFLLSDADAHPTGLDRSGLIYGPVPRPAGFKVVSENRHFIILCDALNDFYFTTNECLCLHIYI